MQIRIFSFIICIIFNLVAIQTIESQTYQNVNELVNHDCQFKNYEKIYVKTDKSTFAAGSEVYHSIFALNGNTHTFSTLSKIAYVEIADKEDKRVAFWKAELNDGYYTGYAKLPDTISTGIYYMRSYTNWLRNLPSEYIFSKPVLIYNLKESIEDIPALQIINAKQTDQVAFVPGGNTLISGYENRVLFQGLPGNIPVEIKDHENNLIDSIQSDSNGRGSFGFIPEDEKVYFAYYTDKNGNKKSVRISSGSNQNSSINVKVSRNDVRISIYSAVNQNDMQLALFQRGQIIKKLPVQLKKGENSLPFPKNEFKAGIAYVALVSKNSDIINERFFYIAPEKKSDFIEIKMDKSEFQKRESVNFEISSQDFLDDEIAYINVSISEDNDLINRWDDESEIDQILLINSEMTGLDISDMDIYNEPAMNMALSTVRSDQYVWFELADLQDYEYQLETKGYLLTGKILNRVTKVPYKDKLIHLSVKDSVVDIKYYQTAEDGVFNFLLNSDYNNKGVVLQMDDENIRPKDIIWSFDTKELTNNHVSENSQILSNDIKEYIEYLKNIRISQLVYDKKTIETPPEDKRKLDHHFYYEPTYTIYPDDFVKLNDFKDIADNILLTVKFKKDRKNDAYSIKAFDGETRIYHDNDATVFLDGIIINDLSYIEPLGTDNIKKIQIIPSIQFYGDLTFYGVVSIFTKKGGFPENYIKDNSTLYPNVICTKNTLTQLAFLKEHQSSSFPDFRQTLFWDPDIKMKSNDNYKFTAKTADLKSSYIISVEGITNKGNVIHKQVKFNVL